MIRQDIDAVVAEKLQQLRALTRTTHTSALLQPPSPYNSGMHKLHEIVQTPHLS
jgi:hypothetical protein